MKSKTKVLIIGAGPVGLTLAVELARRNLDFVLIDKSPEPSKISKALAVHARTMDMLEDMGVAQKFIERGNLVHGTSVYHAGHRLVHLSFGELPCSHPYVVMLPQSETETIMLERLTELGGTVERAHELVAIEEKDGGVHATIKTPAGEEKLEALYAVACDGSHSSVRHILNLPFHGSQYEETFACVDAKINTHLPHDELHSFFHEKGAFVLFPLPEQRWRILYDLEHTEKREKDAVPTLEEAQAVMNERGPGMMISDPTWFAYFRVHRRQVDQYRHGRILLAGDAAHIHSPVGGQGMNTGMQDVVNLAWKLDLVVRNRANDKLLDSYQDERHPVAKDVLAGTDIATKVATLRNPVSQTVRNRLIPLLVSNEVIQQRMLRQGSMVAINYRNSKIVAEHRAPMIPTGDAESPTMAQRYEFAHGPQAGERAPDACIEQNGSETRLFDRIRGTGHKVLLFDGADASQEGYDKFVGIATFLKEQYADLLTVYVVTPREKLPVELGLVAECVYDPQMEAHRVYGANCESLYLIRPDGYVGMRTQPAIVDHVFAYMTNLLGPKPVVVHATL